MMKFNEYNLEDVCDIQIGKTPRREVNEYWGKGYSWVSISDMKSKTISKTKEEITEDGVKKCGCKLIPIGTVLLSFKLSIGKLAFAGKDLYTNEAIVGLKIKNPEKLSAEYLFYVLKFIPLIGSNNAAMGSTLNKESLRVLKLPIPEKLPDQLYIADILTKAEDLISKRKESIRLLDEYLKSTFLEMFGDPVRNEKGWSVQNLENICFAIADIDHKMPKAIDEGGYPFISAKDLLDDGTISFDDVKRISEEDYRHLSRKVKPEKGDIIYSRIGAKLGKSRIVKVNIDFVASYSCCTIKPNTDKVNTVFLNTLLDSPYLLRQALKDVRAIGVPDLGMDKIRNFKIVVPDMQLQERFAKISEKSESIKAEYQRSLKELENLYNSLSQRAFKGELKIEKQKNHAVV